jgi:hypothetical protein
VYVSGGPTVTTKQGPKQVKEVKTLVYADCTRRQIATRQEINYEAGGVVLTSWVLPEEYALSYADVVPDSFGETMLASVCEPLPPVAQPTTKETSKPASKAATPLTVPKAVLARDPDLLPRTRDYPAPKLVFATDAEGWSWLADMSTRLAEQMPDWPTRRDFLVTVQFEASRAGLDPQLVLALIEVLSNFQKYAIGPNGARGYMQVAPTWPKKMGEPNHDLFALRTNLRYGCTLLRYSLDQANGDLYNALPQYAKENRLLSPTATDAEGSNFSNQVLAVLRERWTRTFDTQEAAHK